MSSRTLIALLVAIVVLAAAAAAGAVALFGSGSATPPAQSLDAALHGALAGPAPAGISARIALTDNVLNASALGSLASSPLLAGGSGRLWIAGDGHVRIELQSGRGDTEILYDGKALTFYDVATGSAEEIVLPAGAAARAAPAPARASRAPSLGQIDGVLKALGRVMTISAPAPDTIAGRAAYTVTLSPIGGGRLSPRFALSFDANSGLPLRVAIEAPGASVPAIELAVTSISYGAVSAADVDVTLPASVKVSRVPIPSLRSLIPAGGLSGLPGLAGPAGPSRLGGGLGGISGLRAAAKAARFAIVAPASLDGLARGTVRLVGSGRSAAVLVSYASGSRRLTLIETALPASARARLGDLLTMLPVVALGSVRGHELTTASGTLLTFARGGVSFVLVGRIAATGMQSVARALVR